MYGQHIRKKYPYPNLSHINLVEPYHGTTWSFHYAQWRGICVGITCIYMYTYIYIYVHIYIYYI